MSQPLSSVKDYRAYASRLAQLGPWVDQAIANMREGIKRGIVHPKPVMTSALPQFKQLVAASTEASIYYTPVKNFPAAFSDADKRALTKLYGDAVGGKRRIVGKLGRVEPLRADAGLQDAWDFNPEISPDGRMLLFTSLRPGGHGLGG